MTTALRDLLPRLVHLLDASGVPFMVAGSVASTTYVPVFVASAEDTVVAKLEWSKLAGGSERQRRDVGGILAARGAELDRVYIERWVFELDLAEEWAAAQAVVP